MLTRSRRPKQPTPPGTWKLQDAKAHFSELVRRAQTQGPQRVTVHGKEAAVIVSAEEFARVKSTKQPSTKGRTSADLVAIMQKGRRLGLKFKPKRIYFSARPPVDFSDEER
jgi:prevent-host-death family protein